MYSSSGINIEDIVIILSKEALFCEESNFLEGFEDKKSVQNSDSLKCCSGVIIFSKETHTLRLLSSSPGKLFKQIKNNRLFIK